MTSQEACKVFEALRSCKSDGFLRDSLMLDFKRASRFRKLQWAGDRHLKSLLASRAMQGFGELRDEGELSELCSRCENNTILARIFDEIDLRTLVDEGGVSVEHIDDAEQRKAETIGAMVGELKTHMGQSGSGTVAKKAEDALKHLVMLIFSRGEPTDEKPAMAKQPHEQQQQQQHQQQIKQEQTSSDASPTASCSQTTPPIEKRPLEPSHDTPENVSKKARNAINQLQWVTVGNGRLAARGRPSREQLAALQKHHGATAVVTLLREDEGGCSEVKRRCDELGLRWKHAPFDGLKDICVDDPTPDILRSLRTTSEVADWLNSGESVIVHCAAGIHRTGVYLYLLLRSMGNDREATLEKIEQMRSVIHEELTIRKFVTGAETLHSKLHETPTNGAVVLKPFTPKLLENAAGDCKDNDKNPVSDKNPISKLYEHTAKNKLQLVWKEEGNHTEGFKCCVVLEGKSYEWSLPKTTKKDAKTTAARSAVQALGI